MCDEECAWIVSSEECVTDEECDEECDEESDKKCDQKCVMKFLWWSLCDKSVSDKSV